MGQNYQPQGGAAPSRLLWLAQANRWLNRRHVEQAKEAEKLGPKGHGEGLAD